MGILDHLVIDNKNNKNQCNYVIEYDPKLNNNFSVSSEPTVDPLSVLTASLIGGKKI